MGSRAATGREAEGLQWHAYASRHFYALLKKPECIAPLHHHHTTVIAGAGRGAHAWGVSCRVVCVCVCVCGVGHTVELEVFARVGTEYPYRPPEWRLRWKVYNGKRGWVPYAFPAAVSADAHPTALDAVGRASPCDNQLKVPPACSSVCRVVAAERGRVAGAGDAVEQCLGHEARRGEHAPFAPVRRVAGNVPPPPPSSDDGGARGIMAQS